MMVKESDYDQALPEKKAVMTKIAMLLLCMLMAACAMAPQKPREPDDSVRIPINLAVPPELKAGE
jgi:hypothetical protein